MADKGFTRSYLLLLVNEGAYSVTAIVVSIVLGRFLGAGELGLFAMLTAYMVLFLAVCNLGVDITLIREYSKGTISNKNLFETICFMRLPLTILGMLLYLVTLYFLKVDSYLLLMCLAVLLLRSSKLLLNALFFSKKCIREIVASDIVFSFLYLIGFFFAVFRLKMGVPGVFASQIFALAISLILSGWLLIKSGILKSAKIHKESSLRDVFHQVKWFSINPILGTIQGKLSFYVLSVVSVPINMGLLAVGELFKSILFRLFNSIFSKILLPTFGEIHKDKNEIKTLFFRMNVVFAIASIIMTILILPLIKPFVLLAYGKEYLGSVLLAQIFILEGMLFTLSLSETTVIKLYREDLSARISIIGFLICLPITVIFYYCFALKGLAFASFIITLGRLIYGTWLCSGILGISLLDTYIPQISGIYLMTALYLFSELQLVPLVIVELAIILSFVITCFRRPLFLNLCINSKGRAGKWIALCCQNVEDVSL